MPRSLRKVLASVLQGRMDASIDLSTQATLSERAKVAQSHVSRILRGESAATVDMLEALAAALRCQPWELLADSEQARREAIERMISGPRAPDEAVNKALPPAPKHPKAKKARKPRRKPL